MDKFKPKLCIVCLDVTRVGNCGVVEETIKRVLDNLLFKWPITVNASVICSGCCAMVLEAFAFKATCIDTEGIIFPYTKNGTPVDLKEIYLKEIDNKQLRSISQDERICRLCMQIATSGFTSVKCLEIDLICKYIPEVNFNLTKEPIICTTCVESLRVHNSFLNFYFGVQVVENGSKIEDRESEFHIKTEEIEIKSEWNDDEKETSLPANDLAVCKVKEEDCLETELSEEGEYKCSTPAYQSAMERHILNYQLSHRNLSEVPNCKSLILNGLICKDISEVQMYKCDKCNFETSYEGYLKSHLLAHKTIAVVQMYKCYKCTFETKNKNYFKSHELQHKSVSKVQMYKCDKCNFETKHKSYLKPHQLKHKSISEVQMYKCDKCNFETKYIGRLVQHQFTHRQISKVRVYKCDACSYKCKNRKYFIRHRLKHIIPKVWMYKCDTCSFETKYKLHLRDHQLRHKDISKVPM